MSEQNDVPLPKLYTIEDASKALHLSQRTIWRYLENSIFKSLYIIPLGKRRRRIFFTDKTFSLFTAEYGQPEQRVKRVYNRTKKRYQRKKKTA